jgi:hypothetical protein
MSCHTVGKHQPKGVAVNARGSDLLKISDRVRHQWFIRWVRDPARIVPGMEMPAITMAIHGVLDDRLDLQLESLWEALNSPSFVVPSDRDTAQEIISLKHGDAPAILRDVMFDCPPGSGWCARAFAIGLPNRQNVLFDLSTLALRGWWQGDFARERTEGKTWLWEPAGLAIWDSSSQPLGLALQHRTSRKVFRVTSDPAGGTLGATFAWSTTSFSYWARAGDTRVGVNELIQAIDEPGRTGFARQIQLVVDEAYEPLVLVPNGSRGRDLLEWQVNGPLGPTSVRPSKQSYEIVTVKPIADGKEGPEVVAFKPNDTMRDGRNFLIEIRYIAPPLPEPRDGSLTSSAHDDKKEKALVTTPAERTASSAAILHRSDRIAPGFEITRLPLDRSEMPTAVAFQRNGTPIVSSLKGRVSLAKDTDRDGFEDTWQPISDHLAAPFGLLVDDDDVIVSHKPEVIRLRDVNSDGKIDTSVVIASGWGLTEDYHDWTFGPVRDSKGYMYIATASDYTHKDRPKEARKWRGKILKFWPGTGWDIQELGRGARYPTGLAVNRDDQVFFTDNQGVQNTFNEINHVIPGSRYGVPALDDPPPDQDPWPEREPAIKIPHPWTRSVNGICFLYADGKWGPFEGHGIGCEYDTRGLIRFSLQKIGDTYQGACYPFTLPEDQVPQDERLLGPICSAVSPNGDLYVGGLRDSGWGGGNNVGELVRVRPSDHVPLGIREVRARHDGLVIDFTAPIDTALAKDPSKYVISSYHRIWQGTYATPDSDRRTEKIRDIQVSTDCKSVVLTLETMRPGFVYELHLGAIGEGATVLWPAEAYYTLNTVPE